MSANYGEIGTWNVQCPRCGRKVKRTHARKEWTGQLVCDTCYDPKHPWLIPLPIALDSLPVPDARPRVREQYVLPLGYNFSVWGGPYYTTQGFLNNPLGSQWDELVGNQEDLPYTAENYPLV